MSAQDIWAVVPMKVTADAKQRLAETLSPAARQQLALAMFSDVLAALVRVDELAGICIVTVDPAVADIAASFGAKILAEGATGGHTAAVMAGAALLSREGRAGMLSVPGDIPLVTPAEIAAVLRAHPAGPAFSIVPAHDGRGSNAVLLTPPDAMPLRFGDDSHLPHVAAARARNLPVVSHDLAGIALDIDTPADLAAFRRVTRATKTSALLATLHPHETGT